MAGKGQSICIGNARQIALASEGLAALQVA
jgi:hypothetical protein